jgi:hypothetical protein
MRTLLALILLASVGLSNSAGPYGNGWSTPRVTVETRTDPGFNQLQVRFKHGGETSDWRNASADPDGDGFDAEDSAEGAPTGGRDFRFNGGNAQYKNSQGQWVNLGRKRKSLSGAGGHYIKAGLPFPCDGRIRPTLVPGSPWFPATAGDARLYDVWFLPAGDDVTTLPDDPGQG